MLKALTMFEQTQEADPHAKQLASTQPVLLSDSTQPALLSYVERACNVAPNPPTLLLKKVPSPATPKWKDPQASSQHRQPVTDG